MGNSPSRPAPAGNGGREQRRESAPAHSTPASHSQTSSLHSHSSSPSPVDTSAPTTSQASSSRPSGAHTHARVKSNFSNTSTTTSALPPSSRRPQAYPDATTMGNEQSRLKQQRRRRESESNALSHTSSPVPPHSPPATLPQRNPSPVVPVQQPGAAAAAAASGQTHGKLHSDPAALLPELEQDHDQLPPSQYSRPPRMPLPIEQEVYTPGSPIISPADLSLPLDLDSLDGVMPRRTSVLSSTTVDDEDVGEDEMRSADGMRPAVPTVIEWRQPGEKVYVTGTFAGWDRKYRLHRDGPSKHKDALSATINLQPGTHHLKFIVDGDMCLSDHLPTAVDFTNILVNYLEVSPDDLPQPPTEPVEIPSAKPAPESRGPPREAVIPPGLHPPLTIPPTPELRAVAHDAAPPTPLASTTVEKTASIVSAGPPKSYHSVVPRFLADLDAPEDSSRFARAGAAANTLPAPPSLPLFLGKSILNMSTPMKDDSSVLMHPNHTVLNHLATSSIRSHVLATSATTRYKRKFLTTIMYKPTSEVGD